jgi:hypothetical protein
MPPGSRHAIPITATGLPVGSTTYFTLFLTQPGPGHGSDAKSPDGDVLDVLCVHCSVSDDHHLLFGFQQQNRTFRTKELANRLPVLRSQSSSAGTLHGRRPHRLLADLSAV